MSETTTSTEDRIEKIVSLPWVDFVTDTARDNSTHVVHTDIPELHVHHEIHGLENLGARVIAIAVAPHRTQKAYVQIE